MIVLINFKWYWLICSVQSLASFASEHWNALKTNIQRVLSQLENTFLKQVQMGRRLSCRCHMVLWKDSKATFQRSDKLHLIHTVYYKCYKCRQHSFIHLFVLKLANYLWQITVPKQKVFRMQERLMWKNLLPAIHLLILGWTSKTGIIVPISQMRKMKVKEVS